MLVQAYQILKSYINLDYTKNVQYVYLFNVKKGCENGIPPYLLGDKGYPFISQIMTPFKEEGTYIIL